MQTYLIISPQYYGHVDSMAKDRISAKLKSICDKLKAKNMQLDFASFRYDNSGMLNVYEYCMLLDFIDFCAQTNIMPILNLSHYKLEVLVLLWLHGFQISVHFKESDMPLLRDNICEALFLGLRQICALQNNSASLSKRSLVENLALFNTLHYCPTIAKIVDKLITDKIFLQSLTSPLQHAINMRNAKNIAQILRDDSKRFYVFVSTHSMVDLAEMLDYGISYATISPIFYDKGNKALGLNYLREMPDNLRSISFALGGITSDLQVEIISGLGICGFASIGYFLLL